MINSLANKIVDKDVCLKCKYYLLDYCLLHREKTKLESICKDFLPEEIKNSIKNPFDYQEGGNHYKKEGVMDVTEWCMSHDIDIGEFNVIKYVFRHEKKNGIEDLRKAKHYLEMIAYMKYKENL